MGRAHLLRIRRIPLVNDDVPFHVDVEGLVLRLNDAPFAAGPSADVAARPDHHPVGGQLDGSDRFAANPLVEPFDEHGDAAREDGDLLRRRAVGGGPAEHGELVSAARADANSPHLRGPAFKLRGPYGGKALDGLRHLRGADDAGRRAVAMFLGPHEEPVLAGRLNANGIANLHADARPRAQSHQRGRFVERRAGLFDPHVLFQVDRQAVALPQGGRLRVSPHHHLPRLQHGRSLDDVALSAEDRNVALGVVPFLQVVGGDADGDGLGGRIERLGGHTASKAQCAAITVTKVIRAATTSRERE